MSETAPPSDAPTPAMELLARARKAVTPYLPPPVVSAMRAVDAHPFLVPYTDEPSMAILSALLLGYALIRLVRAASNAAFRRSTIHEDGGDDVLGKREGGAKSGEGSDREVGLKKGDYGETVVLFGPSAGGKTALFGELCRRPASGKTGGAARPFTVVSTRANTGLAPLRENDDTSRGKPVRIVDYPGHPSLSSQLTDALQDADRAVLAVDSTRPVAEAAEVLYGALASVSVRSAWSGRRGDWAATRILVACAKSDVKGAKNWRRIKIQMRTELERLRKVGSATATEGAKGGGGVPPFGGSNKALDLDRLAEDFGAPASLHFLSVSREGDGMDPLREFVLTGSVPEKSGPAISPKSRK